MLRLSPCRLTPRWSQQLPSRAVDRLWKPGRQPGRPHSAPAAVAGPHSLVVIATPMSYAPTTDAKFLETLEAWLRSQSEMLLLIRYSHSAGSKDFELFSSFQSVLDAIRQLPPLTCVIAFRQPQLPLRGVVDDRFIDRCLRSIPDGSEYLTVETVRRV